MFSLSSSKGASAQSSTEKMPKLEFKAVEAFIVPDSKNAFSMNVSQPIEAAHSSRRIQMHTKHDAVNFNVRYTARYSIDIY